MLTVSSLLSNPLLQNFRVAAGRGGLGNTILSTGYFEYEQDNDIVKAFPHGEFVITTLFAAKDNVSLSEKALKLLINNHVAAIAIKNVYFDDVTDEIKAYADRYNVPILIFSKTYIDDLIVLIHDKLSDSIRNTEDENTITTLIFDQSADISRKEFMLRKLNQFFYSDTVFAAYISNDSDISHVSDKATDEYMLISEKIKETLPSQADGVYYAHAFTIYRRGMFFISTCSSAEDEDVDKFTSMLTSVLLDSKLLENHRIGYSEPIHGFADISSLLIESIYANTSCCLRDKHRLEFGNAGTDKLLLPQIYTPDYKEYYSETLAMLSPQGNSSSTLLDTVLAFTDHGGNIEGVANSLFQHKNTIRYRINKISALLGTENDIAFYSALHIFTTIHHARKYLDTFFK